MADTPTLAIGTLTAAEATIYTPSGSATATVVYIRFYQSTGTSNTVSLFVKVGSDDLLIATYSLTTTVSQAELKAPIPMANGNAIRAKATNASQVNYMVGGYEHT